jgi:hypothetical protein
MEQLNLEQALHNIKMALDNFVATKQHHVILEQSFNKILEELKLNKS